MKQIIHLSVHSHLLVLRPKLHCRISQVRFISGDKSGKISQEKEEKILVDKSGKIPDSATTEKTPDLIVDSAGKKILELNSTELQSKYLPKHMSFEDAREAAQKAISLQKRHLEDRVESLRNIFSGKPDLPRTPDEEWYYKKVSFWMKRYENFVGLTDVKAAQARVVESEKRFIEMQEKRRETQGNISEVQKRIKEIHLELEKTHRGEDRYLVLVTQEHQVLKEERTHLEEFKLYEKSEREFFAALSNAVRDSHEKERAQAEKTKYWSILGSIIGTCLGILGTTINNRLRMNELRQLVAKNSTVEEIQAIGSDLTRSFDSHEKELSGLTAQVQGILHQAQAGLGNLNKVDEVLVSLNKSSELINTRFLEESLARVQHRQETISDLIIQHEKVLDEKIENIKSDIFVQNTNVGKLAHIQLKDRERDQQVGLERENFVKTNFELLRKENKELFQSLTNYSKEMDDKIKDVRSLLLVEQRMPKFESKVLDKLVSLESAQKKLFLAGESTSPAVLPGPQPNITAILEAHHRRTKQTVILSTLMVAVLTPVAVYAVNQMYKIYLVTDGNKGYAEKYPLFLRFS
ncbi:uncharacterized protein LOC111711784 isoform X4 [Eurytemora carolleeae]|uniref:uncharacterized protein LOC111711784 isoform X4 n=1 Tax=Eurytemora carolleeae TaxID=1294199 RepID=UPI000C76AE8E|nr:uncharacterized protein LOC111711784 isoform X4 [Eurytemora carolleeae]|eukprot:XP_023341990.1 uncharacterized protein LOC111711784 isoform X4 [Eurytemora affinis]